MIRTLSPEEPSRIAWRRISSGPGLKSREGTSSRDCRTDLLRSHEERGWGRQSPTPRSCVSLCTCPDCSIIPCHCPHARGPKGDLSTCREPDPCRPLFRATPPVRLHHRLVAGHLLV